MSNQLITESNERINFFSFTGQPFIGFGTYIFLPKTNSERRELLHGRRIVDEVKDQQTELTGLP